MKLDKIKFAQLCMFIGRQLDMAELTELDHIVDIDVTPVEVPGKANPQDINELMRAIHAGEKIGAIKAYRTMTGYGLKEAKDAVEAHWVSKPSLNRNDALYVMLKEGRATSECQKDAADWIERLYN